MDFGHLVHNQAQNYQQSQHPQQQGPSQIPDESYIEKLFPKCQPKPSNHMRANRKMARFNERQQQQQKRLSRNRNQPALRMRRERPQEQASNGTVAGSSNDVGLSGKNNNNISSAVLRKRYTYSDSSDNETQTNRNLSSSTNGTIRRSGSNRFGFDATNKVDGIPIESNGNDSTAPELSAANSRPRTKKYQASKSLQQQLSRSQSSHSRLLSNPQPLHRVDTETNPEQRQLVTCDPKGRVRELPCARTDDMNGRKLDRGTRTRRGIVFAEPPGRAGQFEIGSIDIKEDKGEHQVNPKCDIIEEYPSVDLLVSQSRQQILLQEQLPQVQPEETRITRRETADLELIQDASNQDAGQTNVAATATADPYPSIGIVNNEEPIVELTSPKSIQPAQGDEDKFINLFVYDQTVVLNQKLDDKHLGSPSTLQINEQKDDDSNNSTVNSKPDERHRLLATDSEDNEQVVITNDASTEELCSFDDNDTDISLKHRLTKAKLILEDEINLGGNLQQEKHNQDNTNKLNLKHHRSIGTLQTVDEKTETTTENDNPETENNIIKTELINISETSAMLPTRDESNVIRRALVPPGFPQRIRPALKAPTIPEVGSQPIVPVPEPSPVYHTIQPTNTTDDTHKKSTPAKEVWPARENNEFLGDTLGNSSSERADEFIIASESESVVEKNLSEALSKVTMDQMIADNFKNAPASTNLRHHKLPNESSHFSALRSPIFKTKESTVIVSHRSSGQFNTLSDNESGHDEISDLTQHVSRSSGSRAQLKRQDTLATTNVSNSFRPSVSAARVHENLQSTAKTALVFPRLDEGLSSEAESNDEEAEEDDRAMEADVDADDDDDEDDEDDEDVDEDADSPTRTIGDRQSSLQASVDSFFCHPQQLKPQNRSIGSLQQVSSSQQSQESDLQPMKPSQNTAYANFHHNDDQVTRINSTKTNHTSQNGVSSNYWMSGVTNQQATMSSQPIPSASQLVTIQRNQFGNNNNNNSNSTNNNVNLSRSNSYGNRDDAKTTTRVSSDTDNETDRLLGTQRNDQLQKLTEVASGTRAAESQSTISFPEKQTTNSREVQIEGVLFNVKYLGSTHTECEGRGEKEDRIQQAEMAVHEVKFRNGELQTAVEAQLFISTEKIMVLDDKKRVIMMDHSLRTISYIADIGDAVVLIVRKKSSSLDAPCDTGRPMSKTSCHVFESNESHTITKSISQAFHVAYTELLKANGGGDHNSYLPKELDYQEVLNSQEMPMTELDMFASKNNQREVIVPKQVGEILGLSIVESGWGSVLPTAVIASLKQDGPAYRCKKLSVGDQILSINGESLVGLSLAECQQKLRKTKAQSVARLWVVPCPITVEVKIKRPDTKYQLGFSVQHGVICSLLRGGIAERGGVRVGHRIISINGTTVVGVPHDKIVTLLASSVGEIRMKTCLTSLYRHMLGEEKKHQWV